FWMGEKESEHLNKTLDYNYWMSRFPITNTQFGAFVKSGGYQIERYWREAKKAGVWKNGKVKGRWDDVFREEPYNFGVPFNLCNHPVVGVTWYEALAFTRWLTETWQQNGTVPKELVVQIPSEAEWEKAARGGVEIPERPIISSIKHVGAFRDTPLPQQNLNPKRTYPWGDQPNANLANYGETGIGTTSAVGCFVSGASLYGCEEMSGNVWEWTRNILKDYPYKPKDGREDLGAPEDDPRVLRGGAFYFDRRYVRCAYCYWYSPGYWNKDFGFRVVLFPL
ncbi:MAG: formylglycine-generating enzyme family protein, partial [Candidatus Heimdallarchaeota archaeon]